MGGQSWSQPSAHLATGCTGSEATESSARHGPRPRDAHKNVRRPRESEAAPVTTAPSTIRKEPERPQTQAAPPVQVAQCQVQGLTPQPIPVQVPVVQQVQQVQMSAAAVARPRANTAPTPSPAKPSKAVPQAVPVQRTAAPVPKQATAPMGSQQRACSPVLQPVATRQDDEELW